MKSFLHSCVESFSYLGNTILSRDTRDSYEKSRRNDERYKIDEAVKSRRKAVESEEKRRREGGDCTQCSRERGISQTRAIYFANDDELDGAPDTALPSENLANKRRKQERSEQQLLSPLTGREIRVNVSGRVIAASKQSNISPTIEQRGR